MTSRRLVCLEFDSVCTFCVESLNPEDSELDLQVSSLGWYLAEFIHGTQCTAADVCCKTCVIS